MKPLMKPKLLILALCILALASCNNEPEMYVDGNDLPVIEMYIAQLPIAEAKEYLTSKGYELWDFDPDFSIYKGFEEKDGEKILRIDTNYVKYDFYETNHRLICIVGRSDDSIYHITGTQYFPSDTIAFHSFKTWLKYMEKKRTKITQWRGSILIYGSGAPTTYVDKLTQEERKHAEEIGRNVGTYKEFKKAINELSVDQYFAIGAFQHEENELFNGYRMSVEYATVSTDYYSYNISRQATFIYGRDSLMNSYFN